MNDPLAGTSDDIDEASAEAELVGRIAAGEGALYATLVERYQRPLHRACLRLLGDADEADDVVQETFVRAFERLDRFDPSHRFYTWIHVMARNRCLNQLRRRRVWRLVSLSGSAPPPLAAAEATDGDAGRTELRAALGACRDELADDHRSVFDLRHAEEFRYEEIASALEIPIGTVMSRLSRARSRMRACLEGRGFAGW